MTESEAESLLAQYDTAFTGATSYTDISASDSGVFFSTLESTIMTSLCRDRVVGEDAIEANSNTAIVRILRSNFVGISNGTGVVSCETCTGTVNETATVSIAQL